MSPEVSPEVMKIRKGLEVTTRSWSAMRKNVEPLSVPSREKTKNSSGMPVQP
jgi:hypothetical protein